jgi:hypothetical protein
VAVAESAAARYRAATGTSDRGRGDPDDRLHKQLAKPVGGTPLTGLLGVLGWSPERLARGLNTFAEWQGLPDRIHPKTPYKWAAGDIPRSPWRAVTAAVLTEACRCRELCHRP